VSKPRANGLLQVFRDIEAEQRVGADSSARSESMVAIEIAVARGLLFEPAMTEGTRPRADYIEPGIARAPAARRDRLRRARAPYSPPSLDDVRRRLERLLAARLDHEFRVVDLAPLTGGASKTRRT
jgi:hypothetical protein